MGKCETKNIQTDLESYKQLYPGVIQAYSKPCGTLTYSKLETYSEHWYISEPWYIQNPGIFNIQGLFRHLE